MEDEKVYEYVLNDLKVNPENILFIDDDTSNISLKTRRKYEGIIF